MKEETKVLYLHIRYHVKRLVLIIGMIVLLGANGHAQGAGADHLYAILVNGGRNRLTNHERYWNDCAFLYRTLRQTYHVPKRHITVLMSDGGAAYEDMLQADGRGFRSSPVDLDGDGQADVDYPATSQALVNVLFNMSLRLKADDHLFLYIIDHGGSEDDNEESFIWLWDDEKMNDYSLAALLSMLRVGTINILMGQCHSGGFVADLAREGCIIATACSGSEQSWACPDRPYDEFVYHWTCAVNGADETGKPVDADDNGDGEVSMLEAFRYAQAHDRLRETPQYASWPEQLGEQWTVTHALSGTLGIQEIETADENPAEMWTLSGQRRTQADGHAIYIQRKGGKTRKIIR